MFRVNRITWEVAFLVDACRGSVLGLQWPWMVEALADFHSRHFLFFGEENSMRVGSASSASISLFFSVGGEVPEVLL